MWMRDVIFYLFSPINILITSSVGGGGCYQTAYLVLFALPSRPRAGLVIVKSTCFGLAINTLNVRSNNNKKLLKEYISTVGLSKYNQVHYYRYDRTTFITPVSLLIFTRRLNPVLTHGNSPDFRGGSHSFIS